MSEGERVTYPVGGRQEETGWCEGDQCVWTSALGWGRERQGFSPGEAAKGMRQRKTLWSHLPLSSVLCNTVHLDQFPQFSQSSRIRKNTGGRPPGFHIQPHVLKMLQAHRYAPPPSPLPTSSTQ